MMQTTEKLSITLPIEMAQLIRNKVSEGGYSSTSELIREALRTWISKEQRLAALDAALEKGIVSADAGRVQNLEEVRAELRRYTGA